MAPDGGFMEISHGVERFNIGLCLTRFSKHWKVGMFLKNVL